MKAAWCKVEAFPCCHPQILLLDWSPQPTVSQENDYILLFHINL